MRTYRFVQCSIERKEKVARPDEKGFMCRVAGIAAIEKNRIGPLKDFGLYNPMTCSVRLSLSVSAIRSKNKE